MVGGKQMLAPILDPFDRSAQLHRREADQHILRVELAAHAEAATDMDLVQMQRARAALEHAAQGIAGAVRDLGGTIEPQHVAAGIMDADSAARLHRHGGVPSDLEIELDHRMGRGKRAFDIAEAVSQHRGLSRPSRLEFAGSIGRREQRRQCLDFDRDEIGGILGDVAILREHRGDRLADIAHNRLRQDRLAVRQQCLGRRVAEIDRWHAGDIGAGPDRDDAGQRQRRRHVDGDDPAMRHRRADDPHVQLVRKRDIADVASGSRDQ